MALFVHSQALTPCDATVGGMCAAAVSLSERHRLEFRVQVVGSGNSGRQPPLSPQELVDRAWQTSGV